MKNGTKRLAVIGALAALATMGGAGEALARSEAAIGGSPSNGADAACFTEVNGSVTQGACSGIARNWSMVPVLDSNSGITIRVRAVGAVGTARIVTCRAISVDGNGANLRMSTSRSTARHDGVTEELALPITPHGFGGTIARCGLEQGTTVRSFHY